MSHFLYCDSGLFLGIPHNFLGCHNMLPEEVTEGLLEPIINNYKSLLVKLIYQIIIFFSPLFLQSLQANISFCLYFLICTIKMLIIATS